MKCGFPNENKECNIYCEYYHTCTRGEYRKKEEKEHGRKEVLLAETPKRLL